MKIEEILSRIPEYQSFLTVEEMDNNTLALAQKYPNVVKVFEAGKSQKNHPIYCLEIGSGSKNAIIFGCPHPNEPIGAMMLESLSEILATDEALRKELDYTFYIIKTADPDGVKLNEGWFKGPYTFYNYARHFYRPASAQQVEWTFPLDYKTMHFHSPLPETQAIMKIIEEKKPEFLFSLHNSAFGGVYWYINGEDKELVERLPLAAKRQNLPLNLGEPEMPCCKVYANAVFEFPGMPLIYDFYEQVMPGVDPATLVNGGSCSIDFANEDGRKCKGIVCEMPYFKNDACMDLSASDITRIDAVMQSGEIIKKLYDEAIPMIDLVCKYLPTNNSYYLALQERKNSVGNSIQSSINYAKAHPEEYIQLATVAQKFDNLVMLPYMHLIGIGMIASAAEEVINENNKEILQPIINKVEAILKQNCLEIEKIVKCEPIPIKKLVSVQMESGLIAAKKFHH